MASQTSALPDGSTLTKPAYTDSADIAVINTNMDKIVSNINAENQAISTLNSNLTSLLVYERHELTFGQCSPNTDYTQTKNVSKTGYSVLGVVDFSILGTFGTHFHVSEMTIANYTNLRAKIRANSSSSFITDNTKINVLVLYKKIIS